MGIYNTFVIPKSLTKKELDKTYKQLAINEIHADIRGRNNKVNRILNDFWSIFPDDNKYEMAYKIDVLRECLYKSIRTLTHYRLLRSEFDECRGIYTNQFCWVCNKRHANHRHHIIPLIRGGTNTQRNIVYLCRLCHEIIHPWMRGKTIESIGVSGLVCPRKTG